MSMFQYTELDSQSSCIYPKLFFKEDDGKRLLKKTNNAVTLKWYVTHVLHFTVAGLGTSPMWVNTHSSLGLARMR